METVVACLILLVLFAYTVWVSALVGRNRYLEVRQKVLQIAIAWCLPVLGALAVHLINRTQSTHKNQSGIEPQQDQGVDYASFSHPNHDQ